jgi:response regulator RpfG family c-di-GMP phosphodiesterase
LIVDDEPQFRRLLRRWIEAGGVTAAEAESAEQALLLASQDPPRVALCDINMPRGQTGFWLIEQLHHLYPETAVVVMSGLAGFDAALADLRAGVIDYIVKPFPRERMTVALDRAFAEHRARAATTTVLREIDGRDPESDRSALSIDALLTVLRTEDQSTARQAVRVAHVAVRLAARMGVEEPQLSDIHRAALLRKITRLDVHGIARHVAFLSAASAIACAAEERWDGKGFPMGLKGDAIPLGARILGLAEAYDALIWDDDGPGRVEPAAAVGILTGARGSEFDPQLLAGLGVAYAGNTGVTAH